MEKAIAAIIGIIALLVILGLIIGAIGVVIEVLWDNIMPDIFGLPEISYWQAVQLFALSYLLTGGSTTVSTITRKGSE